MWFVMRPFQIFCRWWIILPRKYRILFAMAHKNFISTIVQSIIMVSDWYVTSSRVHQLNERLYIVIKAAMCVFDAAVFLWDVITVIQWLKVNENLKINLYFYYYIFATCVIAYEYWWPHCLEALQYKFHFWHSISHNWYILPVGYLLPWIQTSLS